MATTHLKNYIDGRWVDSSSGDAFEDTDPANGDIIATATKSTTVDVDKAVESARRAYDSWRLFPAPKPNIAPPTANARPPIRITMESMISAPSRRPKPMRADGGSRVAGGS